MNCPYCNKRVLGLTGLEELQAFQKHLNRCPKKPKAVTVEQRPGVVKVTHRKFNMNDALELRAKSGQ